MCLFQDAFARKDGETERNSYSQAQVLLVEIGFMFLSEYNIADMANHLS